MTDELKFKYYTLPPEGLNILREYRDGLVNLSKEREIIIHESEKEIRQLSIDYNKRLEILWKRMALLCNISPHETWGNSEYGLESRFLDEGFGALTYTPQKHDPLYSLFGESQREARAAAVSPDTSKMN